MNENTPNETILFFCLSSLSSFVGKQKIAEVQKDVNKSIKIEVNNYVKKNNKENVCVSV